MLQRNQADFLIACSDIHVAVATAKHDHSRATAENLIHNGPIHDIKTSYFRPAPFA